MSWWWVVWRQHGLAGWCSDQQRWSHITTNVDQQWQNTFADYMKEKIYRLAIGP
ncbi:MAG: hypothetical protein V4660_09195 [Pseudomonadota bacterium]